MAEPERPFYHRLAWAYDLLVDDPTQPWGGGGGPPRGRRRRRGAGRGVRHRPTRRGAGGARSRDHWRRCLRRPARCGTLPGLCASVALWLVRGDLPTLDLGSAFAVVACRGVLNDMLEDGERDAALAALARHVAPGGALIVDVRDRDATARRSPAQAGGGRRAAVDGGVLGFRWRGRVDPATGHLLVDEECCLLRGDREEVVQHTFAMRCWTLGQLREASEGRA